MGKIALATLAATMFLAPGPSQADEIGVGKSIRERDVRAISAKRYSELLRLACLNGLRFRPGDITSGFRRNYEETRLSFVDDGYTILPDDVMPRLIVAAIATGERAQGDVARNFGCFRARWSDG